MENPFQVKPEQQPASSDQPVVVRSPRSEVRGALPAFVRRCVQVSVKLLVSINCVMWMMALSYVGLLVVLKAVALLREALGI